MAIGTAVEFMAFSDPDELASTTKSTQFIYLLPLIRRCASRFLMRLTSVGSPQERNSRRHNQNRASPLTSLRGPGVRLSMSRLSQGGRQVLGHVLNRSESRRGAAAPPVLDLNDSTSRRGGRPLHCGISIQPMTGVGQSRRSNTSDEFEGCPLHLQSRPNFGAAAKRGVPQPDIRLGICLAQSCEGVLD